MQTSDLTNKYLERFKIDPNVFQGTQQKFISALKDFRCPLCKCRLKWFSDGSGAYCKSKKNDKFYITDKTISKYVDIEG